MEDAVNESGGSTDTGNGRWADVIINMDSIRRKTRKNY